MKKVLLLASLAVASLSMSAAGNGASAEQYADTTVVVTTYNTFNPGESAEVAPIEGRFIKNKYFKAMWVNESQEWTDGEWIENPKSDFGVAINWGGMQCFTSKPILDMVDIGLDIHFAASYVSYKSDAFKQIKDGVIKEAKDDMHHGSLGIGIGPAVAVAPFGAFDNLLRYLTAKVYYHFTPSYSCMITKDEDDKTAVQGAFCLYQSFGGEISYRRLGIGIESLWGKAKYKELDLTDYIDGVSSGKSKEKHEIKTPSFRIYVAYKF